MYNAYLLRAGAERRWFWAGWEVPGVAFYLDARAKQDCLVGMGRPRP